LAFIIRIKNPHSTARPICSSSGIWKGLASYTQCDVWLSFTSTEVTDPP